MSITNNGGGVLAQMGINSKVFKVFILRFLKTILEQNQQTINLGTININCLYLWSYKIYLTILKPHFSVRI